MRRCTFVLPGGLLGLLLLPALFGDGNILDVKVTPRNLRYFGLAVMPVAIMVGPPIVLLAEGL
jgi:hypothetical protein